MLLPQASELIPISEDSPVNFRGEPVPEGPTDNPEVQKEPVPGIPTDNPEVQKEPVPGIPTDDPEVQQDVSDLENNNNFP